MAGGEEDDDDDESEGEDDDDDEGGAFIGPDYQAVLPAFVGSYSPTKHGAGAAATSPARGINSPVSPSRGEGVRKAATASKAHAAVVAKQELAGAMAAAVRPEHAEPTALSLDAEMAEAAARIALKLTRFAYLENERLAAALDVRGRVSRVGGEVYYPGASSAAGAAERAKASNKAAARAGAASGAAGGAASGAAGSAIAVAGGAGAAAGGVLRVATAVASSIPVPRRRRGAARARADLTGWCPVRSATAKGSGASAAATAGSSGGGGGLFAPVSVQCLTSAAYASSRGKGDLAPDFYKYLNDVHDEDMEEEEDDDSGSDRGNTDSGSDSARGALAQRRRRKPPEQWESNVRLALEVQPDGRVSVPPFRIVTRRVKICGTMGCTLPDRHRGLHRIPSIDEPRKRRHVQSLEPTSSQQYGGGPSSSSFPPNLPKVGRVRSSGAESLGEPKVGRVRSNGSDYSNASDSHAGVKRSRSGGLGPGMAAAAVAKAAAAATAAAVAAAAEADAAAARAAAGEAGVAVIRMHRKKQKLAANRPGVYRVDRLVDRKVSMPSLKPSRHLAARLVRMLPAGAAPCSRCCHCCCLHAPSNAICSLPALAAPSARFSLLSLLSLLPALAALMIPLLLDTSRVDSGTRRATARGSTACAGRASARTTTPGRASRTSSTRRSSRSSMPRCRPRTRPRRWWRCRCTHRRTSYKAASSRRLRVERHRASGLARAAARVVQTGEDTSVRRHLCARIVGARTAPRVCRCSEDRIGSQGYGYLVGLCAALRGTALTWRGRRTRKCGGECGEEGTECEACNGERMRGA